MAGIIGMSGVGGGSSYGEIINFKVDEVGKTCFFVSYDVRGAETDCTHNLVLNGKELGADGKVGNGHFELTVANLEPETEYGVQIKINNNNNNNGYEVYSKTLAVKTEKYPIYSVIIDETDPNPSTRCTYANDSIDIPVATHTSYGGWENIYPYSLIRPCGLKNGAVVKYINPNDYTKYEDETPVTEDVDVMIEIPKFYWNTERIDDSHIRIDISQWRYSDYWDCPAHTSGDYECDFIYVGAYEGTVIDDRMRSVRGQTPTTAKFVDSERYCYKNGQGYVQYNYFSDLALEILFLMAYKNTNSQDVLGFGNKGEVKNTGYCDTKGMIYGEKIELITNEETGEITDNGADEVPMKFLGIENLWGNTKAWLDGIHTDEYGNWVINMKNEGYAPFGFNKNYIKVKNVIKERTTNANLTNRMANIFGFRDTLFLPSGVQSIEKIGKQQYYCDGIAIDKESVAMKGNSNMFLNEHEGIFNLNVTTKKEDTTKAGSRLVYIPPNPDPKIFGVRVNETAKFPTKAVNIIENSKEIGQPKEVMEIRTVKKAIEIPIEEIPMTIPEIEEGIVEDGVQNGDKVVSEDTPMTIPEVGEETPKTKTVYKDVEEHYYKMNDGEWEWIYPYSLIRPVGIKDGKIVEYINKNDFTKYIDGTTVAEDTDVFIEFPKLYWSINRVNFEEYEVKVSDRKVDDTYVCLAHTVGDKEVNNIYIGAYEASQDSTGKVRSQSGKTPLTNISLTDFRTKCQARGNGYNSFNYYSALLLEVLYLIIFPYLNCQSNRGLGYGVSKSTSIKNTGFTDKCGMHTPYSTYYEARTLPDGERPMKFLGIENLWGNTSTWVDGIHASTLESINSISLSRGDVFNDTGEGYEKFDDIAFSNGEEWIVKVHADSRLGFIAKEFASLETRKDFGNGNVYLVPMYADSTNIKVGNTFTLGGSHKDTRVDTVVEGVEVSKSGIFCLRNEATSATVGGRLIYIPES